MRRRSGSLGRPGRCAGASRSVGLDGSRGSARARTARSSRRFARRASAPDRTAAIAVDLRTGETVYGKNVSRSLLPASAEKLAVSLHRAPGSRAALPVPDGGRRRRRTLGARLARQPRPRRLRRPHAHARGPRPPGPEIRGDGDSAHRGPRLRGRHALRHAPRRARLEVVVPRHRVATAVGARCRRPSLRRRERLGRCRCSRVHGSAGATRHRRQRTPRLGPSTGPVAHHRLRPLGAAVADRPTDGRGQRQLRRRDGVEGARVDRRHRAARAQPACAWFARRSRTPASRSPECASRTGRGSRASTAPPSARSRRSCVPASPIRRFATPSSPRSPSPASPGR